MQTLYVSRDMARVLAAAATTGQMPWRFASPARRTGEFWRPSPSDCRHICDATVNFLWRSLAQDELYKREGYRPRGAAPMLLVADGWNGWRADVLERTATDLPDGGWEIRAWDPSKAIAIRQPATGAALVEWQGFPGLEEWLRPPIPAHTGPVRRF